MRYQEPLLVEVENGSRRHGKIPILSHLHGRITLSVFLAKET